MCPDCGRNGLDSSPSEDGGLFVSAAFASAGAMGALTTVVEADEPDWDEDSLPYNMRGRY